MPSLILDLDVDTMETITGLDVPERFDAAYIVFRYHGVPVGAAWLPAEHGSVSQSRLLVEIASAQPRIDTLRVKRWLRQSSLCRCDNAGLSLPRMSVAICTRDRPDDLARCLAAVCALPDDGQDVLVVDSASRADSTRAVVSQYPAVRYLRHDHAGLDRARNRAMREAQGDVVAFIDDDAVPDHNWLRALRTEFKDARVMGVTGLAVPLELETPAQEWFERTNAFSRGFMRRQFDGASDDVFFVARIGAGVNMALRRDLLERVGEFDEALGAGTPTKAGDEHDMFTRILAAGYCMVYQPAAMVRHRHRREWSELHDAVRGYGTGVYAYLTRHLLHGELRAPYVAVRWFGSQLQDLVRGALRPSHRVRASLVMSELAGCVVGPFAYLRSRSGNSEPPTKDTHVTAHRQTSTPETVPVSVDADNAHSPYISVIVLTHNRQLCVKQLVTMLAESDYLLSRFEVIVVANGCTDDTVAVLRALSLPMPFRVEVVSPDSGSATTAAHARNRGAALAKGELLLFLDDDIKPAKSLLTLHAASFRDGIDRVLIGAPIPVRSSDGGALSFHEIAMWSWWESRLAPMSHSGYRFAYDDLFTGVVSIPAALFARVGGFDETFACREDSELGVRLLAAGAQFFFSREAGGLHEELRDSRRHASRKRAEGRADVQLARKHAALWPALRIAWPLPAWWSPIGAMRRLAYVGALEWGAIAVLEPMLTVFERLRARGAWRAVHSALAYYWYWRGVADTVDHGELQLLGRTAAATNAARSARFIDADLAEGAANIAYQVDMKRPEAIRLTFFGELIGTIPVRQGAEPLRGVHLCATLAHDHAAALSPYIDRVRTP